MEPFEQPRAGDVSPEAGTLFNRNLWHAFMEKAWLVVCIMAAAAAAGIWTSNRTPPVYQSRAVMFFDFGEQKVLNIEDVDKREKGGVDLLNTIANNIRSSGIIKRVVTAHNLTRHPYFTGGTNTLTESQVMAAVGGMLDARLRRFTRLIDVTAESGDPALAQTLAQAVVEEYIKQNSEDRTGVGQNAGQFLMAEEMRIKERLLKAERSVQQYLATNNISLQQGQDILTEEFRTLSENCTAAKTERLVMETDYEMTKRVGSKVSELLTLVSIARTPEVQSLKEKIQAQETSLANLKLRYREKHPAMIQAHTELNSLRQQFEDEVLKAPVRLSQQLKAAQERERGLEQVLKEQEKKLNQMQSQRFELDRLQGDLSSQRKLYDAVIQRLREIDLTGGMKKNDVRIIEPANLPSSPIRPNKRMILIYSLAMGFGLSFGLVWLIAQLDTSIKSVDQAESLLGLPVLGAVPKNKLVKDGKSRLFMSDDPQSLCAEAFRSMRASLALLGREEDRKVVFFTSAVPSEGKSFCCVNYAVAYAQQGRRTLVIDFDLRKPTLAESFGLKEDLAGVSDVLLGKATLDQSVQKTRFENLFLLTAGRTVPNPAELLSGQWARQLIREAAGKFDHVVLDNAPVNAVSDALLIVKEAQTVCLVANARKTSYRVVQRALEMLRRAGAKPSGVVLNFLPQSAGSGYYYYYSGNKYYGKKGVYGATSSRG
ncbi:MAG: Capsular exopolysaccharide family [Limisphaerales bacterium]|nr:MAG: Capsular exopolysaccharide family [Limisphaerales bacterium]KAG0507463.1 MAG: Capsular exopolysaccharide family [Limisphaerales bacterium]TXT47946.1 MAG: Capsular exopolysaccharide family [Limisphaerales bacterium]